MGFDLWRCVCILFVRTRFCVLVSVVFVNIMNLTLTHIIFNFEWDCTGDALSRRNSHFRISEIFLCVLSVKCFEMYYALHTYICHFKFRLAKCADELNFERRNATSQEERILIMSILTLFRIFEPMWSSNFDYMFVLLETDKKRTIFKHMWIFLYIFFPNRW